MTNQYKIINIIAMGMVLFLFNYVTGFADSVGDSWLMRDKTPQHSGYSNDSLSLPFQLKWAVPLSAQPLDTRIDQDMILVKFANNLIQAFDTSNGTMRWSFTLGQAATGLLISNGVVYAGDWGGNLYALNENTGTQLWQVTYDVLNEMTLANGVIYTVGVDDGILYAISTSDGSTLWTRQLSSANYCCPAVDQNIVYAATNDTVYAVSTTDGSIQWTYPLNAPPGGAICVGDGAVFVGTVWGDFYSINTDGRMRWEYTPSYPHWWGRAIINQGQVFVGVAPDRVYAFNSHNGSNWFYTTEGIVDGVAVASNLLFVGSRDNVLRVFDVDSGNLLSSRTLGSGGFVGNPAIGNGVLYLPSGMTFSDATLFAITSNSPSTTATPPNPPSGLIATAGNARVGLYWNPNADWDLLGYNVYKSTDSTTFSQLNDSLIGSTFIVDTAVSNGSTYYYVVRAVNVAYEESGNSNEVSATPLVPSVDTAESWLMSGHDPHHTGYVSDTFNLPLQQKWAIPLDSQPLSVRVDGERVFVSGYSGLLQAYDTSDGSTMWSFNMHGISANLLVSNNTVYAGDWAGNLFALDELSGTKLWQVNYGVLNEMALANGVLYTVGVNNGVLYALRPYDGSTIWTRQLSSANYCCPVVDQGIVYAATNNLVYAVSTVDGSIQWTFLLDGPPSGGLCFGDGALFIGTVGGSFFAINSTGTLRWQLTPPDNYWWGLPIVNQGQVYVGVSPNRIYVFDSQSGHTNWFYTTHGIVDGVAVAGNLLFTGSRDNGFRVFDVSSKNVLFDDTIGTENLSNQGWVGRFAISNDVIYVPTGMTYSNPTLYAYVSQPPGDTQATKLAIGFGITSAPLWSDEGYLKLNDLPVEFSQ